MLELKAIEKKHPQLKDSSLILLSDNFSQQTLERFNNRGYQYFDEELTSDKTHQISSEINKFLWSWFIDSDGIDQSEIDGCSLGSSFAPSLEILFTTIFKYQFALENLLDKNHSIYFSSLTDDIFIDIVTSLQSRIGFSLNSVKINIKQEDTIYGQITVDSANRKRDLSPIFLNKSWKNQLASFLSKYLHKKQKNKKHVIILPAGKLESYIEYAMENFQEIEFRWIIPIQGLRHLFTRSKNMPLPFHISAYGVKKSTEIVDLINRLKENLKIQCKIIDVDALVKIMDRYTFKYFLGAYNYYCNAKETLIAFKPSLLILCSSMDENNILAAQAGKALNIKTASMPHGLTGWCFNEYHIGKFAVFKYELPFGKVDTDIFTNTGMEQKNIHETPFPYFEKFLTIKRNTKEKYNRALILKPDYQNNSVAERLSAEKKYYNDLCILLETLNIKVAGIKARHIQDFKNNALDSDKMIICGKEYKLISGYTTFPNAVRDIDIIIGTGGTAFIESGLLGKDYYIYHHLPMHEYTRSIPGELYNYTNTSFSIDELKDNIINRKPFKDGSSIKDLVDLDSVKTKEQLFKNYELSITKLLDK